MEQTRLEAEIRKGKGKGQARSIRRLGMIPGIIYGHKQDPVLIQLQPRSIKRLLRSGGENVLVNMDIRGSGTETVMLKEAQIDPLTRSIIHVDFVRVSLEERITTHIPISLVGISPGVKEGGILEFLLRELRVECQVGKIPEHIEIDISSLNIGDQIRVGDIKLDEDMIIHDDPATTIVVIATPTVIKEPTEEEAITEEKEPEVITERRREEEEEE